MQGLLSYCGWIKKKGEERGHWHKRFLKLDDTKLTIFRDEKCEAVESEAILGPTCKVDRCVGDRVHRFTVQLPEKLLSFVAETEQEKNRWIGIIETAIKDGSRNHKLSMDDFNIISVIGRGFYGKVMLVEKKDTRERFAIKSIQKKRLRERNAEQSVINERNLLMQIDHPFIVKLHFAFQAPTKFYLGLEYAAGGELFYLMQRIGAISIDDARLYTAELILALDHLHRMGIIYRDLKPENVLLDAHGHVLLTDFGLAKDIAKDGTASTFCGTCEYLAPEVVMHKPYSYSIDFWALGAMFYEMILGNPPFYNENQAEMYQSIINDEVEYPEGLDMRIQEFINAMLCKDPAKRPTVEQIKKLAFFEDMNWDYVYNRVYSPMFVPNVEGAETSVFDPEFTREMPVDSYIEPSFSCNIGRVEGFSFAESGF